jgi:hypothetical protein
MELITLRWYPKETSGESAEVSVKIIANRRDNSARGRTGAGNGGCEADWM